MKRRKIYLTALCILLTGTAFATAFQEQTENWLQHSPQAASNGAPTVGNDTKTGSPTVPVGDAVWLLAGLGVTYGLYLRKKEKTTA
jgi:hypothetical protein